MALLSRNFGNKFRLNGQRVRLTKANFAGWLVFIFSLLLGSSSWAQITNRFASILSPEIIVSGSGFMEFRNPATNEKILTRNFTVQIDFQGNICDENGMLLQGIINTNTGTFGDINTHNSPIGPFGNSPASACEIDSNGWVFVRDAEAMGVACMGRIALRKFAMPEKLLRYPHGYLKSHPDASPDEQSHFPGDNDCGLLSTNDTPAEIPHLELSSAGTAREQGIITSTGVATGLAVFGRGYFVVRDPVSNARSATRVGLFHLDGSNYLVNYDGLRVQGFNEGSLTEIGDIQIATNRMVAPIATNNIVSFMIQLDGRIDMKVSDGQTGCVGQILLTDTVNAQGSADTHRVLEPYDSGSDWTPLLPAITNGFGWIISGGIEGSRCDEHSLAARARFNHFGQGYIQSTGNPLDLAINGAGFFTLRDPTNNVFYATRHGEFHLENDWLVDRHGYRVQGYTNFTSSHLGDIFIVTNYSQTVSETNPPANITVATYGLISVVAFDPLSNTYGLHTGGVITLSNYRDLQALVPLTDMLYSNVSAAQPIVADIDSLLFSPFQVVAGTIVSRALEAPFEPQPIPTQTTNQLHLTIRSLKGDGVIESSSDLQHWTEVKKVTGGIMHEAEHYLNPSPDQPRMFYRIQKYLPN